MARTLSAVEHEIKLRQFSQSFLEFEEENGLFFVEIRGRRFWDYVRCEVFNQYPYSFCDYSGARSPVRPSPFQRLREAGRAVRYRLDQALRRRRKYDILIVNYDRNRLFDGRWVNITTYPLIRRLCSKFKILLLDPASFEVRVEENYPCDVLRLRPYTLEDRLLSSGVRYTLEERALIDGVASKFEKRFGFKVELWSIVRQLYSSGLMSFRRYRKIFEIYRPDVVLYADNANVKGLIDAAHQMGVTAVDLQHALVSPVNLLYHYPESITRKDLPSVSDYVLSFGPYWEREYRSPIKPVAAGFPYLEIEKKRAWEGRGLWALGDPSKNIIMVTDCLFSKIHFINAALELSSLFPQHTIYFKLRPDDYRDWQKRYPRELALRSNIKVIDNDRISLYQYFAACSFQVGTNSTALYEGLAFGLTTFILRTGWYEEMERLYANGHAFLVTGASEIADIIKTGKVSPRPLDPQELFRPGSLDHMESVIAGLIAGKSI